MKFGKWYNEYKSHVRIHDYFSIMIDQFPILVIRRYDFDLHNNLTSTIEFGIIGFTFKLK